MGATPAGAGPVDKEAKDLAHELCASKAFRENFAEDLGNASVLHRGQCQKVLGSILGSGTV